MFDEDGGGSIDVEEVHKLVLSLLQLTEAGDRSEESVGACVQVRSCAVGCEYVYCDLRRYSRLWTRMVTELYQKMNSSTMPSK